MRQPSTVPPRVRLKTTAVSAVMLLPRTAFFAPSISTPIRELMLQLSSRLSSPEIYTALAGEEMLQPARMQPEEVRLMPGLLSGPMISICDILQPGASRIRLPLKIAPGLPVIFRLRSAFPPE